MKKLCDIIKCEYNTLINDIEIDSRKIKNGDLFVAIRGFNVDHSLYIKDAIKNGASAVVTESNYKDDSNIPIIKVEDVNLSLIDICKKMYDFNEKMNLFAITGTDGKTTTATILKRILNKKEKIAYFGTNGVEYENNVIKTDNTTPTEDKLYKYFNAINKNGIENIVMETSSEALFHGRLRGLSFKYAIYTNITEDHLNIHKTLQNYIEAKLSLANYVKKDGYVIVNIDDDVLKNNLNRIDRKVITYGKSNIADYKISNINFVNNVLNFDIEAGTQKYHIQSNYVGEFNAYNITAAFIVCILEQMDPMTIIEEIKKLDYVIGRNEKLDFSQDYTLILDYAHTLNGIKNIVNSFKNTNRRILVLTGAAGGREKEKRKYIGKFLLENTYFVIFTMDDPRYENVDDIIDDMVGDSKLDNYKRIISRKEAINYILSIAKKDDVVLILGKGRDNYMAIEDKKVPYSDYNEIKKYFEEK